VKTTSNSDLGGSAIPHSNQSRIGLSLRVPRSGAPERRAIGNVSDATTLADRHLAKAKTATSPNQALRHRQKGWPPGIHPQGPSMNVAVSLPDQIEKFGRALTAVELAGLLAVSRITVFKLAKAGRIPCFRIGSCVRFDPRAVAAWLRKM
jgi:excisionase family DNA binding protein